MALTYADTAALMGDMDFRNRVKVACLRFAHYITTADRPAVGGNTLLRWAQETFNSPDTAVTRLVPSLVMDDKVQEQGSRIIDADLQGVVETAVNRML